MAAYQTYVPVHLQDFHRIASPLTPVHSPHQSLSSTPSRTPVHTLTLHEYRKQQNTPSPHVVSPGRSLKRKAAASKLGSLERVPLVSSSSSVASTRLDTRSPLHQTLPPPSAHRPLRALQSITTSTTDPDSADGLLTTQPRKVLHFKASKRLPKPLLLPKRDARPYPSTYPLFPAYSVPSPPSADSAPRFWIERSSDEPTSSTEHLRSSAGLTTSSTVSLSRFPHPPPSNDAFSAHHDSALSSPRAQVTIKTTAPATPPATPAVLHYRGTSFDLLNPHSSLNLHDIVTPGDLDPEAVEYFLERQSAKASQNHIAKMAPPRSRPLYTDLRDAHSNIARSPPAFGEPNSVNTDAPLPPRPARLKPNPPESARATSPYFPDLAPPPLNVPKREKPAEQEGLLKRFSSVFKKAPKVKDTWQGFELQPPSRASGTYNSSLCHNHRSASFLPAICGMPVENPRGGVVSTTALANSIQPADEGSVYTAQDGTYQKSVWGGNAQTRDSVPYNDRQRELGRPSKIDGYSFPGSGRTTVPYVHTCRLSIDSADDNAEKTDTIGEIYKEYARELPLDRQSSSFSKFEFAESPSSAGEDYAASVRQSQGRMYSHRNPMFNGPGMPPGTALPLGPPINLRQSRTPYGNDTPSSERLSTETSYGDTRHLLMLQASGLSQSAPAFNDRFAGSVPSASVGALPRPSTSGFKRLSNNPFTPGALEPSSSYSPDGCVTPTAALATAEQIFSDARIGAKTQTTGGGIPRMWRTGSVSGTPLTEQLRASPGRNSLENLEGQGLHEEDWETVGENSRSNLRQQSTDESLAEYSSRDASFDNDTGRQPMVHPGNATFAHTPKRAELDSGEVVMPPRNTSTAYQPSSPPVDQTNPFNSSPPTIPTGRLESYPPFHFDDVLYTPTSTAQGFVGYKSAHSGPPAHKDKRREKTQEASADYQLSDKETEEFLLTGPSEEIIYDDQYDQQSSMYQNSPSFSSARAEPPTMSSLGGEWINSFDKFTVVGPKGNLTGTPLGTGMREVGSSLADDSSPGIAFDSPSTSHHRVVVSRSSIYSKRYSTQSYVPNRFSYLGTSEIGSPHDQATPSLSVRSSSARGAGHRHGQEAMSPSSSLYSYSGETPALQVRPLNFGSAPEESELPILPRNKASSSHRGYRLVSNDRFVEPAFQEASSPRLPSSKRASVANQTTLRDLRLVTPDIATIFSRKTSPSTVHFFVNREDSLHITSRLRPLASEHSPHLLNPGRPSTPTVIARHSRYSWMIFAICCAFPPLLILLSLGYLDGYTMCAISHGEFPTCGNKQKKIALWVGPVSSLLIPILITVCVLSARGVI